MIIKRLERSSLNDMPPAKPPIFRLFIFEEGEGKAKGHPQGQAKQVSQPAQARKRPRHCSAQLVRIHGRAKTRAAHRARLSR